MLFTPPGALTVAILVALAVVAILMIPCFLYLRDWRLRVLPGVVALVSATVAVIFGRLVFTGWALYNNGRPPDLGCWTGFVIINAIIAVAAGSPGGLLGLAIGLAIERRRSPKKAQAGRTQKAQE